MAVSQSSACLAKVTDLRVAADVTTFPEEIESVSTGVSASDQQVSLARSPPVKSEDGVCAGLLLASYDRTLVVKEISSEEVAEMHNILSEYHQVGDKALDP